jgi:lipopolysaccharide/colanic/teichoic acid biosynthesis glycosyltransferase
MEVNGMPPAKERPDVRFEDGMSAIPTITGKRRNGVAGSFSDPEILLPAHRWYLGVKSASDFVLALTMFVFAAPIILLAIAFVKLTSRGPGLYTQTRLGRNGKPFTIYKIRTMYHECESLTGARWSVPGDARITRLGRFLRKSHIDELPQLWNVLRGDMSLIGPRPERPEFVPALEQAIPYYRARLLVRPGVTGFAQVQLAADTDLESVRLKLAYDLYYVRHVSFGMDLRIYWATALKMASLPFRLIRSAFGFPGKEVVDKEYKQLAEEYQRRKRAHAAVEADASEPVPAMG